MKALKAAALITACAFSTALTGCITETTEVRERAYVQTMVVSESYGLKELILYPFADMGEVMYGMGGTVSAAVEDAAVSTGKEIFSGHTELICISSPVLTKELEECLNHYRISPSCQIMYLHKLSLPEGTDTTLLTDSIAMEGEKGKIPYTDLFTVLSEIKNSDSSCLMPVLSEQGFGMGIISEGSFLGTLSDKAVSGLVWLRGDSYPEIISIAENKGYEDFEVYSSSVNMCAEIREGIPYVNITVTVKGKGNGEAAKNIIKGCCTAAIQETVKDMKADVIGLRDCLARDCYDYFKVQNFDTVMRTAIFQVDVILR